MPTAKNDAPNSPARGPGDEGLPAAGRPVQQQPPAQGFAERSAQCRVAGRPQEGKVEAALHVLHAADVGQRETGLLDVRVVGQSGRRHIRVVESRWADRQRLGPRCPLGPHRLRVGGQRRHPGTERAQQPAVAEGQFGVTNLVGRPVGHLQGFGPRRVGGQDDPGLVEAVAGAAGVDQQSGEVEPQGRVGGVRGHRRLDGGQHAGVDRHPLEGTAVRLAVWVHLGGFVGSVEVPWVPCSRRIGGGRCFSSDSAMRTKLLLQ